MVSFKTCLFYTQLKDFVIPVYIFNGRKQTLVDMIGILSALRMCGLHDKHHLLAKLRICGSENYSLLLHVTFTFVLFACIFSFGLISLSNQHS